MAEQGIAKSALGRVGIWTTALRNLPEGTKGAVALEQLGFPTIWVPGAADGSILAIFDQLLDATTTVNFATGILNIWKHEPADLAAWWRGQTPERQARLFIGLGVSHSLLIGEAYAKPLTKMQEFLDGLDAAGMPAGRLCLAALGPKMLRLSTERTAGAHPYMVTPRHTEFARKAIGPDAILAPEQGVVLEPDPVKAREIARTFVGFYARLPNYANSWRREGYSDTDIETLSDRLVDGLIVGGDVDAIAARVAEHHKAGADHVCLQVIGPSAVNADSSYDLPRWRSLATLL